jgi:hypothetical protein
VKAATHDGATARFLVQEFKRGDESLTEGQRRLLVGLARLPGVTCWLAIARPDRQIGWADFAQRSGLDVTIISPAEYARRFWVWWETDGARV